MMRLAVEQGKLAGYGFDLERPAILVGRGRDCDIILDEHQVSRKHARLHNTPQGWMLTDLGSTNGTRVNGQQLPAGQPRALQPGDRITLGTTALALKGTRQDGAVPQKSPQRGKPHPALLVAGALLAAAVLVGIVVVLVLALQDKGEPAIDGPGSLDQVYDTLPIPTLIEGIATALPVPTQLEALETALPGSTAMEDMKTSLPIPTQLEELVTALPIPMPELPIWATATAEPAEAWFSSLPMVGTRRQGARP
jgi:hypothetical protein